MEMVTMAWTRGDLDAAVEEISANNHDEDLENEDIDHLDDGENNGTNNESKDNEVDRDDAETVETCDDSNINNLRSSVADN